MSSPCKWKSTIMKTKLLSAKYPDDKRSELKTTKTIKWKQKSSFLNFHLTKQMYKNKPVLLQTSKHVPTFFPTTKKETEHKRISTPFPFLAPTLTSSSFSLPFTSFFAFSYNSTSLSHSSMSTNILIKIGKIPQIRKKQSMSLSYLRPISFIYSFLFFTPPAAKTFCPISFPTENKKTRPT